MSHQLSGRSLGLSSTTAGSSSRRRFAARNFVIVDVDTAFVSLLGEPGTLIDPLTHVTLFGGVSIIQTWGEPVV